MSYEAWLGHIDQRLTEAAEASLAIFHTELTGDTLLALRLAGHYRGRGLKVALTGVRNTNLKHLYVILAEGDVQKIGLTTNETVLETSLPQTVFQHVSTMNDGGSTVIPFPAGQRVRS